MDEREIERRRAYRHVVIGAGEAGTRAALALRDGGARHIVLIDAESGFPYERPPLSKPEGGKVTIRHIATDFAGVDTRFGIEISGIDREQGHVELAGGDRVAFDRLLLATGARARPLLDARGGHILSLRNRSDAAAIYARAKSGNSAVIIGAGLIGLELAAMLRGFGMIVTVVEGASHAMARALPKSISDVVVARHRSEGVRIEFDAKVAEVGDDRVVLAGGEAMRADLVISAIGALPNTALAERCGLRCGNGIHIDSGMRTSDERIFAAGDCAAIEHPRYGLVRFESWRNACDQGVAAAAAMLGDEIQFATHPWFWTDQYDLGVQMVGLHDPAKETVRRDYAGGGWIVFELDCDGLLRAASGVAPGRAIAKDIRLAEKLIEGGTRPPRETLGDPAVNLKSLLPRS